MTGLYYVQKDYQNLYCVSLEGSVNHFLNLRIQILCHDIAVTFFKIFYSVELYLENTILVQTFIIPVKKHTKKGEIFVQGDALG